MKLTTTVYKYKSYAHLILLFAVILFFVISLLPAPWLYIGIILFVFIPIYAAIKPRSIFSLRSADERKLIITPDELIFGTMHIPIQEAKKLQVYIYAFDSFRHANTKRPEKREFISEQGDRNTIAFKYKNNSYHFVFYLGVLADYEVLVRIIQRWRNNGIELSARSAFSDRYIREQTELYKRFK